MYKNNAMNKGKKGERSVARDDAQGGEAGNIKSNVKSRTFLIPYICTSTKKGYGQTSGRF